MSKDFVFTSRSVTGGHPDKLCDQISDALVGQFLRQDPVTRINAECAVSTGILFIAARFDSAATLDIPNVARQIVEEAGYSNDDFSARTCTIMTNLLETRRDKKTQKPDKSEEDLDRLVVSDQCMVFGFACNHNAALMPHPIYLAHKLARQMEVVRQKEIVPHLAPEAKAQVSVEFRNRRPHRIYSINLIASQKTARMPSLKILREDLSKHVIDAVFSDEEIRPDPATRIDINAEGVYLRGGPAVHSGLTGRKSGVDTYGDYARHTGMALSGKDPTRIGRTGTYAARHAARNVVAAGLADECEVQLSYTSGLAGPISLQVETFGTGRVPDQEIVKRLTANFDFRLGAIIRNFNLRFLPMEYEDGFYHRLAVYGHLGRVDMDLPWERTDRKDALMS
jgi:S-adenosylmethionine synthetase